MLTGAVVFFKAEDGYSFIETEAMEDDVFFHMADVGGLDLAEGQELKFDIVQEERGPRATNVKRQSHTSIYGTQRSPDTRTAVPL
jgi:CspA family cold shock protein